MNKIGKILLMCVMGVTMAGTDLQNAHSGAMVEISDAIQKLKTLSDAQAINQQKERIKQTIKDFNTLLFQDYEKQLKYISKLPSREEMSRTLDQVNERVDSMNTKLRSFLPADLSEEFMSLGEQIAEKYNDKAGEMFNALETALEQAEGAAAANSADKEQEKQQILSKIQGLLLENPVDQHADILKGIKLELVALGILEDAADELIARVLNQMRADGANVAAAPADAARPAAGARPANNAAPAAAAPAADPAGDSDDDAGDRGGNEGRE